MKRFLVALVFVAVSFLSFGQIDEGFFSNHYTIYSPSCDIIDDNACSDCVMWTPKGNIYASFLENETIYIIDSLYFTEDDDIYDFKATGTPILGSIRYDVTIGISVDYIDFIYSYFTIRYWNMETTRFKENR